MTTTRTRERFRVALAESFGISFELPAAATPAAIATAISDRLGLGDAVPGESLRARAERRVDEVLERILGRPMPALDEELDLYGVLEVDRGPGRWYRFEHLLGIDLPPPLAPRLGLRCAVVGGFLGILAGVSAPLRDLEILGLILFGAGAGWAVSLPLRSFHPRRPVRQVLDALVAEEPGRLLGDDPLTRAHVEEIVFAAARRLLRRPDPGAETELGGP